MASWCIPTKLGSWKIIRLFRGPLHLSGVELFIGFCPCLRLGLSLGHMCTLFIFTVHTVYIYIFCLWQDSDGDAYRRPGWAN